MFEKQLAKADAVIILAPEWHGSLPRRSKKLFSVLRPAQNWVTKPALLGGISSVSGGAYPISEAACRPATKELPTLLYPRDLIVPKRVEKVLNNWLRTRFEDGNRRIRAPYGLQPGYPCCAYAQALKPLRGPDRHVPIRGLSPTAM